MFARRSRLIILPKNQIDEFFNADINEQQIRKELDSHTRALSLIKISLPILAAVLCLTLLFLPTFKKDINEFAIDLIFPDGDVEKMTAKNTVLYITDSKGQINNFNAESIKETSAGSKIYELIKLDASLPLDGSEWVNIRSPDGLYDQLKETLRLPRKVELFYSRGLNIDTRDFSYDFKTTFGYSHHPVVGYGFLGHLNSEGIEISAKDHTLTFIGKTSIIIDENSLKKEKK